MHSLGAILLLALGLAQASPLRARADADELLVESPSGPVLGTYGWSRTKNATLTTVRQFLGIPYAKPPVGNLRWAPPQPAEPWTEVRDASAFGAGCYETAGEVGLIRQEPPAVSSEDCLFLNIWTPSADRLAEGGAAVMLWTHGGGLQWGTSETSLYHGTNLVDANDGVIVVSHNYRLNVFGFPNAPGLPAEGHNAGLRDVRRAVEWVHENIAAFGGDPNKIMLFGESAGGMTTDHYAYAYKDDPIIRAASPQSGTMSASRVNAGTLTASWQTLSSALGCDLTSYEENLACARAAPASAVKAAMDNNTLSFSYVADNLTIFTDTAARLQSGEYAHFPYLVGNTDQEIGDAATVKAAFTCPAARVALSHARFAPTWQWRFFGNFPTYPGMGLLGPFHGTEISQIFGTFNSSMQTDEQVASSEYIQKAWVAFAKDPENGLTNYGWPTIDSPGESLVLLAKDNKNTATLAEPLEYHDGCFEGFTLDPA